MSEGFIPNEYVASCYTYSAELYCSKGKEGKENHAAPCALTYATKISGSDGEGHESTAEKWGITIDQVDVKGFDFSKAGMGDIIPSVTWRSYDSVHSTGYYYHTGSGKITSAVLIDASRPNHS